MKENSGINVKGLFIAANLFSLGAAFGVGIMRQIDSEKFYNFKTQTDAFIHLLEEEIKEQEELEHKLKFQHLLLERNYKTEDFLKEENQKLKDRKDNLARELQSVINERDELRRKMIVN